MYFFHCIPYWLSKPVKDKPCSRCGFKLSKKNIVGTGIKQIDDYYTVFVEFKCPQCSYEARFSFENRMSSNNLEKLCYMVLDSIQKTKRAVKSTKTKKLNTETPISDQEADKFIADMNNTKSFEEFLKLISAHHFAEPDHKSEN